MKIYQFGSNGMLGNYMKLYLSRKYDLIPITRQDYDLENLSRNGLNELLEKKGINEGDLVINCVGIIPQTVSGINIKKTYYKINSLFPVILGEIVRSKNCKFIHVTTDCVFSGKNRNEIYNEFSLPDETNDYGTSKSLGELCSGTIIRTSIIGEELFHKKSLLEWVKSNNGNTINGYVNHYWNGVTCLQMGKIVDEIIEKNLYWDGVKHIYSPEVVSKYELVGKIVHIYGFDIEVKKMETDVVDKSIVSVYESLFEIPNLDKQIEEMRDFGKLFF